MATQILSNDIELHASQRMTDADDGGGEMTAVIIQDKINQLFQPISESDRVTGDVALRQGYLHVNTNDASVYRGVNLIVDRVPTDPAVSFCSFDIGKEGGSRLEAKQYIESFIATGSRSRMHPIGNQNAGQSQILAFQKTTAPLPSIGEVYILSNEITGTTQAFKIQNLESYNDTFSYISGSSIMEFVVTVLVITITQPLSSSFPGADPTPLLSGDTWIRRSVNSDSAKFYGMAPLKDAVTSGDMALTLSNIQVPIIPVTTTEQQIVDTPLSAISTIINAGSHNVEISNYAHSREDKITVSNKGTNYSAILRPIPSLDALTVSYMANGVWYQLRSDSNGDITGDATEYGSGKLLITGTASVTLGQEPDIDSSLIWQWGSGIHYRLQTTTAINPRTIIYLGEACLASTLTVKYLLSTVETTATTNAAGIITGTGVSGLVLPSLGLIILQWDTIPDALSSVRCDYDQPVQFTETLYNAAWIKVSGTLSPAPQLTNFPIAPGSLSLSWAIIDLSFAAAGAGFIYENEQYAADNGTNIIATAKPGGLNTGVTPVVLGSVNTTTGEITINPGNAPYDVFIYDSQDGVWSNKTGNAIMQSGFEVTYTAASGVTKYQIFDLPDITFRIGGDLIQDTIVPQSLRFRWGTSNEYRDSLGDGKIYRQTTPWNEDIPGTLAGVIDYANRMVALSDYIASPLNEISILSCLSTYGAWNASDIYARTPAAPVRAASFQIRVTDVHGNELIGESDLNGDINQALIQGTINQDMGIAELHFGELVLESSLTADQRLEDWYDANNIIDYNLPAASKTAWWYSRWPSGYASYIWIPTQVLNSTIKINTVIIVLLPLSPEELGLDPVRLPNSGKVQIFKAGYRLVVHNTQSFELPNPAVAGSTIDLGRVRLSRVRIIDALGRRVPDDRIYSGQYVLYSGLTPEQQALYAWWEIREDGTVWFPSSTNLDAGTIELASPLDLTGFDQPLTIEHTIEDSFLATSVDLSGLITINKQISHSYPADTSYLSSQLYYGDMWPRYTHLFAQATWTSVWSDVLIGSTTASQYNDTLYPIIVTNDGIIDERWRITFTSTTAFSVYGERAGLIATGTTLADLAPINPATGSPYFTIDYRGWGSGWAIGNTLRVNTPWAGSVWFARCVLASEPTGEADSVGIVFRGDSDPA